MKIVVTGARGYIGSVLRKKLPEGTIFLDIDNWDIRKTGYVESDVDVVVHLAALVKVGESVKTPYQYYDTNVNGTMNVIKAFPNAKFILASTGAAFDPTSPYARSKLAAEDIVKQFCKDYTIFRFYNVGGGTPSNPEGLYAATQRAADTGVFTIFGNDYDTHDGTCVRDYVHVEDLTDAIVCSIYDNASNSEYEPLGSGRAYTVLEYAKAFLRVNGPLFDIKYGPRREGDNPRSVVPFMSKFMKPTKTLEDIVKL